MIKKWWNDKTKSLFTPWKLGLAKKSKYWFRSSTGTFDSYLFLLIFLLKPEFDCSSSFEAQAVVQALYLESIKLQFEHKILHQVL